MERAKQTKTVVDLLGLVWTGHKDPCKAPPVNYKKETKSWTLWSVAPFRHLNKKTRKFDILKKIKLIFDRFFANSNFVRERLLNFFDHLVSTKSSRLILFIINRRLYSKNQSCDYCRFCWGIFRPLGTYHFISWSSFLKFRYLRWWPQWHGGLSFLWFIGVDIINSTCFGINIWTGPCTGFE